MGRHSVPSKEFPHTPFPHFPGHRAEGAARGISFIIRQSLIAAVVIACSPCRGRTADVNRPKDQYSKTSVTFDKTALDLSYGQTTTLCATIKGPLKQFITFDSDLPSALVVQKVAVPGCTGTGLSVQASLDDCTSAQGKIVPKLNNMPFKKKFSLVTIIRPKGEHAVLKNSGSNKKADPTDPNSPGCDSFGIGCFYKDYNVLFDGPSGKTLDLTGLTAFEILGPKQQSGTTPNCPFGIRPPTGGPLGKDPSTGLFGIGDHLEIPASSVPGACTDVYTQTVFVESCQVQTNILTFSADPFGTRQITRSDSPQ